MKILTALFYYSIISLIAPSCRANDSIARVATGGITFEKTEDIQMVQEVLEISTEAIRVNYRFLNKSKKDIHTTIAFPMPPYSYNPGFSTTAENNKPLESFEAKVNGQVLDVKDDRRAMVGKKDVTKQLQDIGLTEEQIFETFAMCGSEGDTVNYCNVTKSQEAELVKVGNWEVYETALWDQAFPAQKEITVSHEYTPLVGGWYYPAYLEEEPHNPTAWGVGARNKDDVCADDGTKRAINKRIRSLIANGAGNVTVFVGEVEYILGTGKNWAGSIGDFRLRIIKDSPEQIVSLCFPGKPKRLDARTIEFSQKNFIPQDKLLVNFYTVK
jgi:hypothetical protein